jgi:hypothetical protein
VHTCIQEERVGILLSDLILIYLLSKPGHAIPTSCRWSFICSMIWGERWLFVLFKLKELLTFTIWTFLGIVELHSWTFLGIVDIHSLNFPRNCWPSLFELSYLLYLEHIGGVTVSVPTSSAVDRGFEPRSGQTKDYQIGICCFSAKHAALRRKNKDWLAWNQNNVSKWGDMTIRRLLFQWASTIKIQLSVLV